MKKHALLWLTVILFAACSSQKKVIFLPDSTQNTQESSLLDSWQIIESQSGSADAGIPEWVRCYMNGNAEEIEALDAYYGKYVFIGKTRGDNFSALQQWANRFTVEQDLPRLVVRRVERRLVAAAVLYPDDEYGEYFAQMIKKISDEEYPEAVKEQTFWTKQKKIPVVTEDDAEPEVPQAALERYEFLVLITISKDLLQAKIQNIMAGIKPAATPTKDQAAAINRIRQAFFEGF